MSGVHVLELLYGQPYPCDTSVLAQGGSGVADQSTALYSRLDRFLTLFDLGESCRLVLGRMYVRAWERQWDIKAKIVRDGGSRHCIGEKLMRVAHWSIAIW